MKKTKQFYILNFKEMTWMGLDSSQCLNKKLAKRDQIFESFHLLILFYIYNRLVANRYVTSVFYLNTSVAERLRRRRSGFESRKNARWYVENFS
jgi:hypothetical protein